MVKYGAIGDIASHAARHHDLQARKDLLGRAGSVVFPAAGAFSPQV